MTSGVEMEAPAASRAAWGGQEGADSSRASGWSVACQHLDSDFQHLDCERMNSLLFYAKDREKGERGFRKEDQVPPSQEGATWDANARGE